MKEYLTNRSTADDLIRLKKSIQFICEVVQSYTLGLYDHVGFSCAIAISKAEELRDRVSPFCPAREIFNRLIGTLKQLSSGDCTVCGHAEEHLSAIGHYFNLHQYSLTRRIASNEEPTVPNR